ncbi:MAG: hypothetical protein JSW61_04655 [Candidatus Thorarchaeota archaeon]|nr:MAG: hypothetical protein JSW61_04655 [Candidatus Thorarchaeota archaeon]
MKDLVCDGCSLLCDDVKAEYKEGELKSLGLCRLGHECLEVALKRNESKSSIRKSGKSVSASLDEAVAAAAKILREAKRPLVYGWTRSTNDAIKVGLDIAASCKAFFDTQASLGALRAFSSELHDMNIDYTLDDARNNAEVVIYWGSNPTESSHRHVSRFSVLPKGERIPEGVESRAVVVVDVRETETMKIANHRLVIPFGSDADIMRAISGELTGTSSIVEEVAGIPAVELISLTNKLKNSDSTVFFYGSGLFASGYASENLMALKELIESIRKNGRAAHAMPVASDTNTIGAMQTLNGSTGFPSAVDYSTGSASNSEGQNMHSLLLGERFDAALVVGSDIVATLPGELGACMSSLPLIYIGPPDGLTPSRATVFIPAGSNMVLTEETMLRVDQEPIQLIPFHKDGNGQLSETEVLRRLLHAVRVRD